MSSESSLPHDVGDRLDRTTTEASDEPRTVAQSSLESATIIDAVAQCLDHHDLLEQIGHGGMGVVFRARDTLLNREVALKMIRSGTLATPEEVARFYREARAAARLRHPHIVPIHGIGLYHGQHCFTMDLITGGSLAQQQRHYHSQPRAAVALLEKVARAVHEAHVRGVIHRDLKPGNILLDGQGEPLVGDFGLAKLIDNEADVTGTGQVVGTPAYMAPEQAAGQTAQISPCTDVWALGVILYELLGGRRPFIAPSSALVTQQVLNADPPSLRKVRPELPRQLETIVLACLHKEPERRYPSAAALADDLRRWLQNEPIAARLPGRWRRLGRFALRHPTAVTASLLLLIFALSAAALIFWRPPAATTAATRHEPIVYTFPAGQLPEHRWILRKGELTSPEAGVLRLESRDLTLVELCAEAPWNRFRVRARVRDRGANSSAVGIYVLHLLTPGPDTGEHWFCALTFSDQLCIPAEKQIPPRARAALNLHRIVLGRGDTSASLSSPFPFVPEQGKRHNLAVQVTPETVRASFGASPDPFAQAIRAAELKVKIAGLGNLPMLAQRTVALPQRGGVGLLCNGGCAEFQDFTIEPLSDDE